MGLTKSQKYRREYYRKNKAREMALQKEYRKRNGARVKEWQRRWNSKNKKRIRELKAKWKRTLKGILAEDRYQQKRRAALKQATPSWLTPDQKRQIKEIYKNCPKGHHIDHVIALLGKNVCGLHVPWNLKAIPITENLKKGNRVQEGLKNESSTS